MSDTNFPSMTTAEIRSSFLKFFEDKGCKVFKSSSLVPEDPSLLLANAGMNQFKQYYLGTKTLKEGIGATSCQKCIRTNDIDAIGLDGRHLSFFEMLGNFSFGGYTKRDACTWALEYITKYLHLPIEKLYVTVFENDDDCVQIWESLGIEDSHISRLGEDDNFWAAGPTGPCGPCSEIYYDQGEDVGCGKPTCAPGCDCDRFLEFWNLVFTQYDRQEDGTLVDLPHQNVDTGMGLERISAIMQHKSSNYDGDILKSLIVLGENLSNKKYGKIGPVDTSLRIIADHARAVTFMIADGILPSNEGRGYVLRRLLRRAVFHARLLGIHGAFLNKYVSEVVHLVGDAYPELIENRALVEGTIAAEEARFSETLETGRNLLDDAIKHLAAGLPLPGHTAFTLHDTYGFPIELTQEIAAGAGHSIIMEEFISDMEAQRERARKSSATDSNAWSGLDIWTELSDRLKPTEFLGYENNKVDSCKVLAIVLDGKLAESVSEGQKCEVVLDKTPFYGEMGGQVADTGRFMSSSVVADVTDVKVRQGSLYSHVINIKNGTISTEDTLTAQIDSERRHFIAKNHTATHLLDASLRKVLGEHVHQAGSMVAPDRLRFDFTHFKAMTPQELKAVEDMVNEQIYASLPVVTKEMGIEDAKAEGAIALFGEKYGDVVRVVSAGDVSEPFSRELCGGTHVKNTCELGLFKIVSESSIGSASRRIEALTSKGAVDYLNQHLLTLNTVAAGLKVGAMNVASAIEDIKNREQALKDSLKQMKAASGSSAVSDAISSAIDSNGYKFIAAAFDNMDASSLRNCWDSIREHVNAPVAACLISLNKESGKCSIICAGTDEAASNGFDANNLLKSVCEKFGGRGGGKSNMAQGSLDASADISAAIDFVRSNLLGN